MSDAERVLPPTPEQIALGCLLTRMSRRQAFAAIARHGSARQALAGAHRPRHGLEPDGLAALCARYQLALLSYFDSGFPFALRHIPDPPLLLYVRGDPAVLDRGCIAVVGARRCSRMGAELAGELAGALAREGLTVVSGLARGIDGAAHRGVLASLSGVAGNTAGSTVAVMGAGLGEIYPRAHGRLAQSIVKAGGALVSEYLPLVPPAKHRFPERNRLISGLCEGVVVVEAGEHSGSLITARFALEQGREVMAVPGAVSSGLSSGCHRLLRDGAALVECAADVLVTLGCCLESAVRPAAEARAVPAALGGVLAAVEPAVTSLDEVVAATGLGPAEVAAKLLELELAGFVQQVAEGYIRRPFSPTA